MTRLLLSRFRYSPDGQICVRILVKGESNKCNYRETQKSCWRKVEKFKGLIGKFMNDKEDIIWGKLSK